MTVMSFVTERYGKKKRTDGRVVWALDEGFSGNVVLSRNLRRVERSLFR
jgi:hypothetical protein